MKRCYLVVFLLCFALDVIPCLAQINGAALNLEVEGRAVIKQNDIASARDEAIRSASQRAILEAASELLSIPLESKKFLPAKREIIERQYKYIGNYKIVSEVRQEEIYSVILNLTVAVSDLKTDLLRMGFLRISGSDKTNITVFLEARGLKKYSDFLDLKDLFKKKIQIVKKINLRSFQWQQAYLEMELSGSIQLLIAELDKTGQYSIATEQVNKNQITITLLPKEGE